MWKENGNGKGEITEAQKARISQNFRAAKALLARKRPRPGVSPNVVKHKSRIAEADTVRRVPLAEITPPAVAGNRLELSSGLSCVSYDLNPNFEGSACKSGGIKGVIALSSVPLEIGLSAGSFATPLKESNRCPVLSNNLSTPTSILDDEEEDFDESVLLEIDAVCERQSAAKAAEERRSITGLGDDKEEEDAGDSSVSDPVLSAQSTVTLSRFSLGGEDTDTAKVKNIPEEYSKYWKSLNDRQREAACNDISIPLMIVAGPGSGKTSTMVGRVLMLLSEGIGPSNILAMTFTTAAAAEMRDRIGAVAGKATSKKLTISTFHSFSLQLCRSHADKLGRTPEFSIYGHGHQRRAIIEAVRLVEKEKMDRRNQDAEKLAQDSNGKVSLEQCKDKSKKWQKFVMQAKASGRTPADCLKMGDEIGAEILQHYNDILKSCDALDYHDLISCSVTLLSEFPEVFKECQETWKAIVIDEFQDTSAMQYNLLCLLASHNRITIVGDDDQSIFSFNGADVSGFDSFRQDFSNFEEIRLNKNYRSTRYIVEAASCLIKNNIKRCQLKDVLTDNCSGSKITIKECQHESAQCAFVVDKIFESASNGSPATPDYSKFAILYRRQISGKLFQSAFRERKIPFNTHGVAFYRKKVVKAILAMLRTTLPGCDDGSYRQVFKALLPFEKDEKKKVVEHIEKISTSRKCSFISAASDIFGAKVSGTFKRSQLTQGRKVLSTLEMISKLVLREQSISTVMTSVANMVPQKYLLEQKAVVDNDGGKYLNEDGDMRSVLQYLLDDVSDYLSSQSADRGQTSFAEEEKGCRKLLKAFIDYITEREKENFRCRRHDNENSVTLTTIHQSKGLEWDIVFIVKVNESEIPLLHEYNGVAKENGTSIEEERRLLYVAMTRARKKLFILYMAMDSNWQMLQPSRFLKEIPENAREVQAEVYLENLQAKISIAPNGNDECAKLREGENRACAVDKGPNDSVDEEALTESLELTELSELSVSYYGSTFLKRFAVEDRLVVSHLFHQWAKKQAFQNPKRLLDKVGFVADERLRVKKNKHKDVLRALKSCLNCDEAFQYAEYVLRWEKIPADQRAHIMWEKQEHFQKLRIGNSMSSSAPTPKQISYLQTLGCTVTPTSRLHASTLIEQYKAL